MWRNLRADGFDPRRDRTGPSWSESIRSQAKAVIATDFACQLRLLLEEYIEHYNTHRPHRGLNQCAPDELDDATAIGL